MRPAFGQGAGGTPVKQEKALVVTADSRAINDAGDDLLSLGLGYDLVDNQEEASRLILANPYACLVLDPEILPSPRCRRPRVEAAEDLLDEVQRAKNGPQIIIAAISDDLPSRMTAADIAELGADLRERGVVRFIRKPFPTCGWTLYRVLKKALRRRPPQKRPVTPKRREPPKQRPFEGGEMVF